MHHQLIFSSKYSIGRDRNYDVSSLKNFIIQSSRDWSGDPVAKRLHSQCRGSLVRELDLASCN